MLLRNPTRARTGVCMSAPYRFAVPAFRKISPTLFCTILVVALAVLSSATPVRLVRTLSNVDWTSAGVGGVLSGSGTINLTTLPASGFTVTKAYLYWHG